MRHLRRQKRFSTYFPLLTALAIIPIFKFFLKHKKTEETPNKSIFSLLLTWTTKILLNIKQYIAEFPQDIFSKTKHKYSDLKDHTLATKSLTFSVCSTDSSFGIPAL